MNERGSAVIELAWASTVWASVCVLGATCMGAVHARTWGHFELYESLICATERQLLESCENRHAQRLREAVPYLSNIRIQITDGWHSNSKTGVLRGTFAEMDLRLQLTLPCPGELIR